MLHEYHFIYSVRYYPRFMSWNGLPVDTGPLLYQRKEDLTKNTLWDAKERKVWQNLYALVRQRNGCLTKYTFCYANEKKV